MTGGAERTQREKKKTLTFYGARGADIGFAKRNPKEKIQYSFLYEAVLPDPQSLL